MRNKFVYSCSVKIHAWGFDNSWKAFSASCWLWKHFPATSRQVLEEVVVGLREVRWIWRIRQNFVAQFIQLLKRWLCDMWSGVVEKNWVFSVDQCQLLEMQFSVHLIDLLSILLRYNGFSGIQKTVVDQTGSRLPNNDLTFFGARLAMVSALELLLGPMTELVVADCHCCIKSMFHLGSQHNWEMVRGCIA